VTTADAVINGILVGRGSGSITNNIAIGSGTLSSIVTGAANIAI